MTCHCDGTCRREGHCGGGAIDLSTYTFAWPPDEVAPWQCPGCNEWKAPHVTSCGCANEVRIEYGGQS